MSLPPLSEILVLLEHYKYILIFPITVVEGPIITIISGLLVSMGYLNGIIAFIVLVLGDLAGDVLYYFVGRFGGRSRWIKKIGGFIGYNEGSEKFLEAHFKKHKVKTFFLGKLAHGVGTTVLVAAGIARVSIWEFIWYNTLGTIPKTLILILIGYYAGDSYLKIDKYLNSIALVTGIIVVVLIVFYIFLNKFAKDYFSGKQKD